jgi:hypothetical protein
MWAGGKKKRGKQKMSDLDEHQKNAGVVVCTD